MKQLKKELENVLEKKLDQKQYKYIYNTIYRKIKNTIYKMKHIYWIENGYGFDHYIIVIHVRKRHKQYFYLNSTFKIYLTELPTYEGDKVNDSLSKEVS